MSQLSARVPADRRTVSLLPRTNRPLVHGLRSVAYRHDVHGLPGVGLGTARGEDLVLRA